MAGALIPKQRGKEGCSANKSKLTENVVEAPGYVTWKDWNNNGRRQPGGGATTGRARISKSGRQR